MPAEPDHMKRTSIWQWLAVGAALALGIAVALYQRMPPAATAAGVALDTVQSRYRWLSSGGRADYCRVLHACSGVRGTPATPAASGPG